MIRHVIVLRDQPDIVSFKEFVKETGGEWDSSPTVQGYEYGVIEKRGVLVMLELGQVNGPFMDFDEEGMNAVRQHLGVEPGKVIRVDIRRNERSLALAKKVEEAILSKWGGYLDRG